MKIEINNQAPYQGWKNYATWNVVINISNDEWLHEATKDFADSGYKSFASFMLKLAPYPLAHVTPDGVSWLDPTLDYEALDIVLKKSK